MENIFKDYTREEKELMDKLSLLLVKSWRCQAMVIKYDIEIQNEAILKNVERITNQIFKLLPSREEGNDWQTPLESLIVEVTGMSQLLSEHSCLFSLLCKMEGLSTLTKEDDFLLFRKIIFECLGLMNSLKLCL